MGLGPDQGGGVAGGRRQARPRPHHHPRPHLPGQERIHDFSKFIVNFISLGAEGGGEEPGEGGDGEQEGAGERRGGLPGGEEGRGLDVSPGLGTPLVFSTYPDRLCHHIKLYA